MRGLTKLRSGWPAPSADPTNLQSADFTSAGIFTACHGCMTPNSFRMAEMVAVVVALVAIFALPIADLARASLSSDLYSYIPLVPLISAFLIWTNRRALPQVFVPARRLALVPLSAGLLLLASYGLARRSGWNPETSDYLALMTVALILLMAAACLFCLGKATLRAIAFPALFLLLAAPIPSTLHDLIERFLQRASADAAGLLFLISGTPVFRQDFVFNLPGFSIEVAPECSGIHSTLVLFIISLLAGHLFLRTVWGRALLALAVLPVALLRNGVRIFTIAQLCVHVGPEMIDSFIHRHGGPIFFVLSLVPFYFCLVILQRIESRSSLGGGRPVASPAGRAP
jgi:exosortase C (VPDSG-CTERM-specific)